MATRLEVETDILFAIDEPGSNWATATGLHNMVQAAYQAAWDLILAKYEDYNTTSIDFTIPGGSSSFTLLVSSAPATGQILRTSFYKLRAMMRQGSTDQKYRAMESITLEQSSDIGADFDGGLAYMFLGDIVYVEPTANAPGNYRAWYTPTPTALAADGDTLVDPLNGAVRQYVIDVCCARLKAKDELGPGTFKDFTDTLEARINVMTANRDGRPRKIPDVRDRLPPRFRTRGSWM
jgi:hypothetical protein